eukprot:801115-Pleurochrysis_carterae.AAC.4
MHKAQCWSCSAMRGRARKGSGREGEDKGKPKNETANWHKNGQLLMKRRDFKKNDSHQVDRRRACACVRVRRTSEVALVGEDGFTQQLWLLGARDQLEVAVGAEDIEIVIRHGALVAALSRLFVSRHRRQHEKVRARSGEVVHCIEHSLLWVRVALGDADIVDPNVELARSQLRLVAEQMARLKKGVVVLVRVVGVVRAKPARLRQTRQSCERRAWRR